MKWNLIPLSSFTTELQDIAPYGVSGWRHSAKSGIRAIAISRPGYGHSARQRGRSVRDIATHISEFADHFGIKNFASVGWSGGGPHALATTVDPRCVGVITLAGVGKFGQPDLDFLAGMGPENIDEFGVALEGESALQAWMEKNAVALRQVTGDEIREAFGGLIGDADKEVLSGKFAEESASVMRLGLERNFDGWVDDDLAFVRDWGFDLSSIRISVHVWQGDDDFMVPHAHSIWLAHVIPSATEHFIPGHGHLSLVVKERDKIVMQLKQLHSKNA